MSPPRSRWGFVPLIALFMSLMATAAFASANPVPATTMTWSVAASPIAIVPTLAASPLVATGNLIAYDNRAVQVAALATTKGDYNICATITEAANDTGNKETSVAYDATTKYTKRDANSTSCEVYADRTTWSGRALATKVIDICIDTAT